MPSGFPLILVSTLKKQITTRLGEKVAGHEFLSVALIAIVYLFGPLNATAALANDAQGMGAEVASQEATVVTSGEPAAEPISVQDPVKIQEILLRTALQELKENHLNEAINNLARLKDTYPDNDDYLLLYRTALRKRNSSDQDSQKWYNYVRSLDKKEEEKQAFLQPAKDAMTVPAPGRINELKRATWVVLTTGKHKSANQGRRSKIRN